MLRKNTLLRTAALIAASATAMTTLAACGTGDSSGKGRKSKGSSSSSTSDDSASKPDSKPKAKPKTGSGGLQLGDTAAEPVEITRSNKTGEFQVTMEKVTVGEPGDLDELKDKKEYEGQVPAWLYATYKHVGGDAPAELSTVNDLGMTVEGGERARPLIIFMGGLSATPDDCVEATDVEPLKAGQSATVCQIFLVPEGKDVETALLSRGFSSPPTEWEVD